MMNADLITWMHPSDVRMNPWGPVTFNADTDPLNSFPCAQWKDASVNNPTTIVFNLTADQVADHTLRIGITTAYAGGRPKIRVNSWTSGNPPPSPQPNSRTLTVGTYRGNNTEFDYAIPASAFVVGQNTIQIDVINGSGATGFLSAAFGYDAVELD
jgi:rhamnogalacturonan endolyase